MSVRGSRFQSACAPNSWGVANYPDPSWQQSYETMLDEMVFAGYGGTELGPYGFFPVDFAVLEGALAQRNLKQLASSVSWDWTDPAAARAITKHSHLARKELLRVVLHEAVFR